MIVQLSVTAADCCQKKLSGLSAMVDDCRAVGCKLEDHGLFCSLPSLDFFFIFLESPVPGASRCCDADNTQPQFVGGSIYLMAFMYCTGKH